MLLVELAHGLRNSCSATAARVLPGSVTSQSVCSSPWLACSPVDTCTVPCRPIPTLDVGHGQSPAGHACHSWCGFPGFVWVSRNERVWLRESSGIKGYTCVYPSRGLVPSDLVPGIPGMVSSSSQYRYATPGRLPGLHSLGVPGNQVERHTGSALAGSGTWPDRELAPGRLPRVPGQAGPTDGILPRFAGWTGSFAGTLPIRLP